MCKYVYNNARAFIVEELHKRYPNFEEYRIVPCVCANNIDAKYYACIFEVDPRGSWKPDATILLAAEVTGKGENIRLIDLPDGFEKAFRRFDQNVGHTVIITGH